MSKDTSCLFRETAPGAFPVLADALTALLPPPDIELPVSFNFNFNLNYNVVSKSYNVVLKTTMSYKSTYFVQNVGVGGRPPATGCKAGPQGCSCTPAV